MANMQDLFSRKLVLGFSVLFVLFLFALLIFSAGFVSAATPSNFVSANGTQFSLNNKPFYFAGTNAYYLFYAKNNTGCVDTTHQGCLISLLDSAKALNLTVIRTWGSSEGSGGARFGYNFQPSNGTYDEATFINFDKVLKEASDRNIKLIVVLTNNWDSFGGMCQYVRWCSATIPNSSLCDPNGQLGSVSASVHDAFYTNTCTKQLYKNYVNYFLNRTNTITGIKYKDDPTIMAWELANEPRARSDTSTVIINNWTGEMSAYVKSIDSNHLVTGGTDGGYKNKIPDSNAWWYTGNEGQDYIPNNNWTSIDFATFNYYDDTNRFDVNQTRWISDHITEAHNILGKPVILKEFNTINASGRAQVISNFYSLMQNNSIDGDNIWMLSDFRGADADGFEFLCPADSSICNVVSNHANYMNSKNSASSVNQTNETLFEEMFRVHMNYFLSNFTINNNGLPATAYKANDRSKYTWSNPTEWGYLLQAYIAASERGLITQSQAITNINKSLNTIITLQNTTGQNYGGLFYPYYYVFDSSGNSIFPIHDNNGNIPSIDNGLLYSSLLITEGWAKKIGNTEIENKTKVIMNKMNFSIFLFTSGSNTYMAHTINNNTNVLSPDKWDVYSDEGGLMSIIAYVSGAIDFNTYKNLTNSQMRSSATWNGYTVKEAAWFNSMFTWGVRSIAGFKVIGTNYSTQSFVPTTKAHLAYGNTLGYAYPGFSDAMTQPNGVGKYVPPNLNSNQQSNFSAIVPHAFFVPLNVISDLDNATINNLTQKISLLKADSANYYHSNGSYPFGFEVTASPSANNTSFSGLNGRNIFETLSEGYTVLSLFNGLQAINNSDDFYSLALRVPGYNQKVNDTLSFLYNISITINETNCTIPTDGMTITQSTVFCPGTYIMNDSISVSGAELNCNGATLIGNSSITGLRPYTNAIIKGCTLKNYGVGVGSYSNNNVLLENNTLINSTLYGVNFQNTASSRFINNTLIGGWEGFRLWYMSNNIFESNIIANTSVAFGFDWHSELNNFTGNKIVNSYSGFSHPISWGGTIYGCNFVNNELINNTYGFDMGSTFNLCSRNSI